MTKRPLIIGLTGSIGMGKSTTAKMFSDEGVPTWDADAAVARLYAKGGLGSLEVAKIAPSAIDENGVNRNALKALIQQKPTLLEDIEAVIHPLVAEDRKSFLVAQSDQTFVLLDIPLLFENGAETQMDFVVVVTAPAEIQKQRVMDRGTMDETTFKMILCKQMPDHEKRQRADFIIETTSIELARHQVQNVLKQIRGT